MQRLFFFTSSACSGYRYGSDSYRNQGQEKDDEVSGKGNSYTAEFWQYDSRLGRRWNIDPVVKHHESPYATFANNPIWFIDPSGADTTFFQKDGSYDSQAKKDFDGAYATVKDKLAGYEKEIQAVKDVLIEKLEAQKGTRKIEKEYYELLKSQSQWKKLEEDFTKILESEVMVVYTSKRGSLIKDFDGLTSVPLDDGFSSETGKVVKILVFVKPNARDIVIHENRHVNQIMSGIKMSKMDKERDAYAYQKIFDPISVENFIKNRYEKKYGGVDPKYRSVSLEDFTLDDAIKQLYKID